jgi:uncharacterized protein (DUF4213/DUF364 family)
MGTRDEIYDLLLDYAGLQIEVERVLVGLNWTLCQAGSTGIAETTGGGQWRGESHTPLAGRTLAELSLWVRKWDRQQAAVGLAAVNAAINSEADMVYQEGALFRGRLSQANALEWFIPRLRGHKVAFIGDENPFSHQQERLDVTHLPNSIGALHPATEVMLGNAEWVFVNGQSVADKTLPRVLELVGEAQVVLYGPQVPWLEEWRDFGIDYLIGAQIDHGDTLYDTIAEGGDIAALPQAISYRVCDLASGQVKVTHATATGRKALLQH